MRRLGMLTRLRRESMAPPETRNPNTETRLYREIVLRLSIFDAYDLSQVMSMASP